MNAYSLSRMFELPPHKQLKRRRLWLNNGSRVCARIRASEAFGRAAREMEIRVRG